MNDIKIEFRGICVETNEFRYGSLGLSDSGKVAHITSIAPKPEDAWAFTYEVKVETIGQFIGVIKTKQDVYIGDIVQHGQTKRIVEYRNGNTMLINQAGTGTILLSFSENPKVLGNIHQNKELLNE